MSTREIVPPEPHSTGPDTQKAWDGMPRWLKIALVLMLIAAGVLIFMFVRG